MHFFTHHGIRLAYLDAAPVGADLNEPILLIHGFASNHVINWASTLWVKTLTEAGRRVIAIDNRGHGQSEKLYAPEDYSTQNMAGDALALMDHLGIERFDVMGYSMGARISAFLAASAPMRVRGLILGGLGHYLIEGGGLSTRIAEAMEAPSLADVSEPTQVMFRKFAESTKSDLRALAACIRGSRQKLGLELAAKLTCPTLVAIGTTDKVAGDGQKLVDVLPNAQLLSIPGRDHNLAVGDKIYKMGVLAFLQHRAA
eukprot:gene15293-biopygen9312